MGKSLPLCLKTSCVHLHIFVLLCIFSLPFSANLTLIVYATIRFSLPPSWAGSFMLRSVHTISSILHTKWMYRHVHTKIWYEYKSRIKPEKEPHAARQLRVSQACSRRTDLLRLLMSAWHYGKENLFLLLLLDFLSWRPKSSWQSGCGTRQWKRDWDWERGLSARVCNRNCTFVLSKRLEWRVQLVMEKVRFPATTQRDVRARLLLERDLVGHNNWQTVSSER